MKSTFILNGATKLVIAPTNDLEKQVMDQLFKQPVEVKSYQTLQVGDETYANCVIITPSGEKKGVIE